MLEGQRPERYMAKLASRARLLPVKMKMSRGNSQHLRGFGDFAYEVDHRRGPDHSGGTQGQTTDGPKMVFKLAGHRAFDRPMPRVMDARSHLVREEFAIVFKEFDGQNAHVVQ